MPRKSCLLVTLAFFLLVCCCDSYAGKINKRKIRKQFRHSKIMNDHFTGFALYDLDAKKMVFELNSDKYFTPASNTKLFTFYTCLKMLGDSVPALKYVIRNDSLIFWGTGDPSFLHSGLRAMRAFNFLKNSGKKLFYSPGTYSGAFYGSGWAWDDYNDYYQAEITDFPVEDNVAVLYADSADSLSIRPAYLRRILKCDSLYRPASFRVKRDFLDNYFRFPLMPVPANFKQEIPWKTSAELTAALLQDTLKQAVGIVHISLPADARTIYSMNADTVYRHMLQPSDNFIAEQLLLLCSSSRFGTLSTDSVISYAETHFLNDLPDTPRWVDGSGLSRYNLFTPRSIVALLCKIMDQVNDEALLHSMLAAGGSSGTVRHSYVTVDGKPFVWLKTGSLSNNYNQSGYLVTKQGKRLAFSFMNNNFTDSSAAVRDELVRIITFIHDTW